MKFEAGLFFALFAQAKGLLILWRTLVAPFFMLKAWKSVFCFLLE